MIGFTEISVVFTLQDAKGATALQPEPVFSAAVSLVGKQKINYALTSVGKRTGRKLLKYVRTVGIDLAQLTECRASSAPTDVRWQHKQQAGSGNSLCCQRLGRHTARLRMKSRPEGSLGQMYARSAVRMGKSKLLTSTTRGHLISGGSAGHAMFGGIARSLKVAVPLSCCSPGLEATHEETGKTYNEMNIGKTKA